MTSQDPHQVQAQFLLNKDENYLQSKQLKNSSWCKDVKKNKDGMQSSTQSKQKTCSFPSKFHGNDDSGLEQNSVENYIWANYNLSQFCWEGCHILPCFCFPPLPPFQCWISMDFSSAALFGKHSTLKRGMGGPANRDRD